MTRTERGGNLPCDTVVYFTNNFEHSVVVWRSTLTERKNLRWGYFTYFEVDGLWATFAVRNLWEHDPSLHPNASLFTILYKNLEL